MIDDKNLKPCISGLINFTEHEAYIIGIVSLPHTLGTWPRATTEMVEFLVINMQSTYNRILERISQGTFGAIPSTEHQVMKFPTEVGIGRFVMFSLPRGTAISFAEE